MIRLLFCLLLFFALAPAFAQNYDAATAPNVYASASNHHYWKQHPPFAGYWQQDVHYRIKATLDDELDRVSSTFYELTYSNNSPDTLRQLFFHLYQNAFTPGSHYHNLYLENDKKVSFGKNRQDGKGIEVQHVRVNGQPVQPVQDNTILQVKLPQPLLPGQQVKVQLDFISYWGQGSMRSRMKQFNAFGYKHFDGVHWYPRLAVYDRKFRWETEQHLDKEYYGNFGQYDVELTLPQEYVLEATGTLQNPQETFPGDLRQRLDLKNFATKPLNSPPSVITPREPGKTKTWKFQAINVHDFAWTADPTYRLGEAEWNGIKCVAIAQEPHAAAGSLRPNLLRK